MSLSDGYPTATTAEIRGSVSLILMRTGLKPLLAELRDRGYKFGLIADALPDPFGIRLHLHASAPDGEQFSIAVAMLDPEGHDFTERVFEMASEAVGKLTLLL